MSLMQSLLILVLAVTLLAIVLHIVMVVRAFKRSKGWGLVCLLVPFGSVVYAFLHLESKGRAILAGAFLVALLAAIVLWTVLLKSGLGWKDDRQADQQGMNEFEEQIKDLENLDDLQIEVPSTE